MLGTDYIERMIQQFARFVARVLFRIRSGRVDEARMDIRNASERFLGLPFDMILHLGDEALDHILGADEHRRIERHYVAAQLLACEAEAREASDPVGAAGLSLRSLNLLLRDVPNMDDGLRAEASSAVDMSLGLLRGQPLPPATCDLLMAYHELRGEFSKAEDRLFELVEHGFEKALQIGVAFYGRLQAKTDQELERGNLPRNEVVEGVRELKARFGG
jgi:hypothetical protein